MVLKALHKYIRIYLYTFQRHPGITRKLQNPQQKNLCGLGVLCGQKIPANLKFRFACPASCVLCVLRGEQNLCESVKSVVKQVPCQFVAIFLY
jgi:hypothetical protein